MTTFDAKISSSSDFTCPDCFAFLKWTFKRKESESKKAVVFLSLVATVKSKPALDDSLEAKAVDFLKSVNPKDEKSADTFLSTLGRTTDESLTDFIQSIVVLISSPNRIITTTAMEMLDLLILSCSEKFHLALVRADLIPQIFATLNPLSLSFAEAVDIHINLMDIIRMSVQLATSDGFYKLKIYEEDEEQAVHETVLKHVMLYSEKYIRHLCVNRFSLVDGDQSRRFLTLLTQLLGISPYYQPTMEFVLHMPVFLTIPSCLTFFENDRSIWWFLSDMVDTQREWNEQSGEVQQMGTTVLRMLRIEGIEDVIEETLQTDKGGYYGGLIVARSIDLNTLLGMNLGDGW
ncbi:hypothetical protein BLNAU_18554 [Blattamonas nauphoetae]|uniref:26S proteasome non-ATPase regulatory subunit 5 n=1 Tax=Blattamonas nauphoetae TaxID=2049346 RepID=A0ABQ9X6I1_9EUKA|nr:hypothetical protein BLNAU_18554 [Blattamonas nauphoetae]